MILKGLSLSLSASSRTTIGGLREMISADSDTVTFGAAGVAGLDGSVRAGLPGPVLPGVCWRPWDGENPPRPTSLLPRPKSGRLAPVPMPGRPGGSLTGPVLSGARGADLTGN